VPALPRLVLAPLAGGLATSVLAFAGQGGTCSGRIETNTNVLSNEPLRERGATRE